MLSRESSLRLVLQQNSRMFGRNISLLRTSVCTGPGRYVAQPHYHSQNQFSFSFQSPQDRNMSNFDIDYNEEPQKRRARANFEFSKIQWNKEELTPFQKHFYQEHPNVARRSNEEVDKMRREAKMLVFGSKLPKPFQNWSESGIPEKYLKSLLNMGISQPTPIQQQGIPLALSGNDVIGISRTGSGKTLTYVLPLLVHVEAQPIVQEGDGPIGLILAPTRELAQQINGEIEKYARANQDIILKHTAVYGGADRATQMRKLQMWPDILVATPGRLLDLTSAGVTNFKRTTYLVLDEADRMLDMGFRRDLEKILSYVRPDKQVLMWSATWPKEIQHIAHNFMKDPSRVQIGSTDLHANDQINQNFKLIDQTEKQAELLRDITEITNQKKKCLIFVNQKITADILEKFLHRNGIDAKAIHGDKTQTVRDKIMNEFRTNRIRVLIATDVVARGIDVRDIDVVLVYDFPNNVEDYIHRIGRTARGENNGVALAYLKTGDIQLCGDALASVLAKSGQNIPSFLQPLSSRRLHK